MPDTSLTFKPDPRNANKGTLRGHAIIKKSVSARGAGRSGLAAKDGTMIAGNQTLAEMQALGVKIKPVHTAGDEWIVVVRDDIEPGSEQATMMGLEDNRSTQLGLEFDVSILADLAQEIDLSGLWDDGELEKLLKYNPPALDVIAELEKESAEPAAGYEPSHVRMVQLFLDTETFPMFNSFIESLQGLYGTANPTDTVMEALRRESIGS